MEFKQHSSQGKHFHREKKQLLYNVIKFCDTEADNGCETIPLAHATKRASAMTGVSESSIRKIRTHRPFV